MSIPNRTKCPKCKKFTVSYDARVSKVKCFAVNCSWTGPDNLMYTCPICRSDDFFEITLIVFDTFDFQNEKRSATVCEECGGIFYRQAYCYNGKL